VIRLGLVERALRETWATTLGLCVIAAGVAMLLNRALPNVQARFMQRGFIPPQVQQIRNTILGVQTDINSNAADIAYALAWSHPVLLLPLLAHAIILTTRVPAGELEKGTMDVLLGLPVRRLTLLTSETVAWALSGALVVGSVMLGAWMGTRWVKPELHPDWSELSMVLVNLGMVYAAVGAAGMAVGAWSDKRGRAVLAVMVLTLSSLVISFLALLWEPMEGLGFLSLLHYYRPMNTLQDGAWPVRDLAVLAGVVGVLWAVAAAVLSRRDLTTT
jgi:hypothetical protein